MCYINPWLLLLLLHQIIHHHSSSFIPDIHQSKSLAEVLFNRKVRNIPLFFKKVTVTQVR